MKRARPASAAADVPPAIAREVAIANRHPRLRIDRRAITRAIHVLDSEHSAIGIRRSAIPQGELSLVFLTDAALAQLHADFLDDPTTTDVITFEGDPALGTAGEICVSADAALRHISDFAVPPSTGKKRPSKGAVTHAQPARSTLSSQRSLLSSQPSALSSFSAELTLYLVHGWLHLAGYDDLEPAKKRAMRRAEARAMRVLARAGGVPVFSLRARR